MKKFSTLKVGYTSGIYGCSGEYFITIIIKDNDMYSVAYEGMYGADERVNRTLKEAGYEHFYVPHDFGKMTKREVLKIFKDEHEAKNIVNEIIHGTYNND